MVARQIQKLSVKEVENKKKPGYYSDGGGLYLQVSGTQTKSWIFRFTLKGKAREMGLGPHLSIGLSGARKRAAACRLLLVDGIDPIEARNAQGAEEALERAKVISFAKCAEGYISAHRSGWKNSKHAAQWESTIETYCNPVMGTLAVQAVDTTVVLKALEPIWNIKPETASRVRGRIESVLNWAAARGFRQGENPARWRGHLDKLLPAHKKESRVKHHPALPYDEVGAFIKELRQQEGVAARALEATILTVARTTEITNSKPDEFDLFKAIWTIPAERMKAKRPHRVPLSLRAVEIIRDQLKLGGKYVFPGQREDSALSSGAMLMLLERMGRGDLTVHGFRSTFRDWSAEQTSYPREVCEMALAHSVGDKVEAAYRRGDLFEKRRNLANDWARYCEQSKKAGKKKAG